MIVAIRFYCCLHRLNCTASSQLMQLPQIHSNKSCMGPYLQSEEYVICVGQDSVVCRAGIKLGKRDSSFCLFKVSGKQKQLVREPEIPTGIRLFLHL